MFPGFQIAPPLPFIPEGRHGDTFIIMVAAWTGPVAEGERALKPIRDIAPVVAEFVGPMPYPALNTAFDALLPRGLQHYWKTTLATELPDGAIAAHLQHGPKIPTMNTALHIYPINGAVQRVPSDATAFAYRDATFLTNIAGVWLDPADNEANITWVARLLRGARALLTGGWVRQLPVWRRPGQDPRQLPRQLRPSGRPSRRNTTPTTCSTSTRTSARPRRREGGRRARRSGRVRERAVDWDENGWGEAARRLAPAVAAIATARRAGGGGGRRPSPPPRLTAHRAQAAFFMTSKLGETHKMLPPGSLNHAALNSPKLAIPSTVLMPGLS